MIGGLSIVTSDIKLENKFLIVPLILGGLPATGFIYLSKLTLSYDSIVLNNILISVVPLSGLFWLSLSLFTSL
jgi:hypothetical protein